VEKTLLIVKPDAVESKQMGYVINRLEKANFKILDLRMERLTGEKARRFYAVHKEKPFYDELVEFMTSGPIVPILLEKENAIADLRILVGATDPSKAADGTIRREIATDVQRNAVHASDSTDTAAEETAFFFG